MNKIDLGNIYGLLVLTMLILYGCAGDTYHVIIKDSDIDDQVTVSNPQPITVAAVVSSALIDGASGDEFNLANYSSEETRGPYTPDTINLPEGRIVHMYVYDGGYTPETGTAVNFALYKATSAGVLTPTAAQYDIKLSPGTYNFYALSEFNNASDKTPPFSNANGANGEKTNLSNELDYLWWKKEGVVISESSATNIRMIFQHISTQIEFQLEVVDGTKITAVSMLTLQRPSPSSCTLQMATGVITPSTTLESGPAQMVLLGDTAAYVDYVPFKVTSKLLLKVCLDLDNGGDSWHDVYLPMPAGNEYKQGVCYMYNLVFDETKSTLESNYIKAKPINYIKQKELYVDF